jgi:hypothetical protein
MHLIQGRWKRIRGLALDQACKDALAAAKLPEQRDLLIDPLGNRCSRRANDDEKLRLAQHFFDLRAEIRRCGQLLFIAKDLSDALRYATLDKPLRRAITLDRRMHPFRKPSIWFHMAIADERLVSELAVGWTHSFLLQRRSVTAPDLAHFGCFRRRLLAARS